MHARYARQEILSCHVAGARRNLYCLAHFRPEYGNLGGSKKKAWMQALALSAKQTQLQVCEAELRRLHATCTTLTISVR